MPATNRLYLMLVSLHGRLRARNPELGCDSDTGGQITYVLELARALIEHPAVEKVDLVTRLIEDPKVGDSYARPREKIRPGVSIVRIPCGPRRYIRKEMLWPYLDLFLDNLVKYLRSIGRVPDLVHGHYADAGYAVSRLASLLDVPMAFTGHSLGRDKRRRLLDGGANPDAIERRYNLSRRIQAEETALNHAAFVVASTHQEVREQYEQYEFYQPRRMLVISPGVDLSRFSAPRGRALRHSPEFDRLRPFLRSPRKPMLLSISRPDPRKNIGTLIRAFGENRKLRETANLVLIAGNRGNIPDLERGTQEVINEILHLIDRHDLYGSVAYPRHHEPHEIPGFYRLAARTRGIFVNPALTEPFGLTLLEAAASGLPVVATDDGGPQEIVRLCGNGLLIDPLDPGAMGKALLDALSDRRRWRAWSRNGLTGSRRHFSWSAHVGKYMRAVKAAVGMNERRRKSFGLRSRLLTADRVLICDLDNTLTGDRAALNELKRRLADAGDRVAFGIATGRSLELARQALAEWNLPKPQVLITSVGSTIRYGPQLVEDRGWEKHINYRWRPEALREAMSHLPGLELQSPHGQRPFKISYHIDPDRMPPLPKIRNYLRGKGLQTRLILSHGKYLDLLPIRASKGMAVRYFCLQWDVPPERCLVVGDSGNDEEMLTGNNLAVVVGNHEPSLDRLRGQPRIYFATGRNARGIIEGIEYYDFLGELIAEPLEASLHVALPRE